MAKSLYIITSNPDKAVEFSRLLNINVVAKQLDLPEIQSLDVREVVKAKAEMAYKIVGQPIIVDDTGIVFNAWNGLPGAFITWFLKTVGSAGLIKMLDSYDDRSAYAITALGYCDENGVQVVSGITNGQIAKIPCGDNGFGYDDIFIPDGSSKTFAEMTDAEKDANSMRAKACVKLKEVLDS
jgi:non-canonical purine NTP pyrophosphatase (RdgB/HAM1 family)